MSIPQPLPLTPLLEVFFKQEWSSRSIANHHPFQLATDQLLEADDTSFRDQLLALYDSSPIPRFHRGSLFAQARRLRHGVNHLLRGNDPLALRFDRCACFGGPYYLPGFGPSFWATILLTTTPPLPPWNPITEFALARLGYRLTPRSYSPGASVDAFRQACRGILDAEPRLSAASLERFLYAVARMRDRELPTHSEKNDEAQGDLCGALSVAQIRDVVRDIRNHVPLRRRLKERGSILTRAAEQWRTSLATGDLSGLRESLTLAFGSKVEVSDPFLQRAATVTTIGEDELPADWWDHADELSTPTLIFHLLDSRRFPVWDDAIRRGYAWLDDGWHSALPPHEGYRLFREGTEALCQQFRIHPLELSAILSAIGEQESERTPLSSMVRFHGFCSDSFAFLRELAENNRHDWMDQQRARYRFTVREPITELCRALTARYIEPVLQQQHGWDLETEARGGRALTSIVKNDFGRTVPYVPEAWITFYRRSQGRKRDDVQFFVKLESTGLRFGLRLGARARDAGKAFRRNIQTHAEAVFHALSARRAFVMCRFRRDDNSEPMAIHNAADLRAWATGKSLSAEQCLPADADLNRSDELVGEMMLAFNRLLPAYVCAVEADPVPWLTRFVEGHVPQTRCDADWFRESTYLPGSWLERALSLLELKKQLILQGVPGTGKTHVAKCLARVLTGDRPEAIRTIQFHPAFSYEEFVEGIKARTIVVDGRYEVTYPIEPGVLSAFAAQAESNPDQPHVLLIDEINRGNLPRIFGELLYLLEYRNQSVNLPYSRREFRLPPNLYLLGTMNSVDRSVALIDQALRRRFSFLEMPPDPLVLAGWLEMNLPRGGEAFGQKVVSLFETLNHHLAADLGTNFQVGHSYFMVPDFDEELLRVVWDHHIRPLLREYYHGNPNPRLDLDAYFPRPSRKQTAK